MASTAPRDVTSPGASKHSPKPATTARPQQEIAPWFWKIARFLGSLQFAIVTGVIFTIAMIIGTCIESWYSSKIAQDLVYYSWWFTLLLGLLGCAIFFAAIKKWPWKKHQTGFLITHVGLLTMLTGGILNTFLGVDASVSLVDSAEAEEGEGPRRSDFALLPHDTRLTVSRPTVKDGRRDWKSTEVDVNPGALPWGTDLQKSNTVPTLIRVMSALARPLPRTVSKQIDNDLQLDVLAHLPYVNLEPVEAAKAFESGYPALKVELNSRSGHVPPEWIALNTNTQDGPFVYHMPRRGDFMMEFLARAEPPLADEFLKPPGDAERGKLGQLVFVLGGKKHRVDVVSQLGKTVTLGESGWKVKLDKYFPSPRETDQGALPVAPYVECQVTAPDGQMKQYRIKGRLVMYSGVLDSLSEETFDTPEGWPAAWYHPPDLRYGQNGASADPRLQNPNIRYYLQFLQTTDNKLYYRSLIEQKGTMVVESAGPAPATGVEQKIWGEQYGNFIIEEHLPHAKQAPQRVVPVVKRPGLVSETHPPALLCRLTLTKKDKDGNAKTFVKQTWVPERRTQSLEITGTLDGHPFSEPVRLSYGYKMIKLDFEIELTRAESLQDPGTDRPATYTSFVKVHDKKRGVNGQDFMITMNEPLDYLGYKFYQSQFETIGIDSAGKPVHRSGFTVGRDPGLWLKYLGTLMIGVGIATMYWMKAYFFKPRARKPVAA